MISSYQLSERISVHCILFYGLALPIYRGAVAIENAWRFIRAALPALLFALGILAKAFGLVTVVAGGAFLALTFWLLLAKISLALVVIALFGWATFPRTKAVR